MTTANRPEVSKGMKKSKRLSLTKKTLKDLTAKAKGPIGGRRSGCSMENSGCA